MGLENFKCNLNKLYQIKIVQLDKFSTKINIWTTHKEKKSTKN